MEDKKYSSPNMPIEQKQEDSQCQILPKGIIPLDKYIKDFHDFLEISGGDISKSFYEKIPHKKFKLTCTIKASQSLLSFPIYECHLKFDNRFVMSAQKGLLGKLIISSQPKPSQDNHMLAKLTPTLKKQHYKLYQKLQSPDHRHQLSILRFSKTADILVLPKVDTNSTIRKRISHRKDEELEKEYIETKTKVTALKLHRNVFRCESMTREYWVLRDMMGCGKGDKMVIRRLDKGQWEFVFGWPLAMIQAFGVAIGLIDKGVI